jgi:hypothetical protein
MLKWKRVEMEAPQRATSVSTNNLVKEVDIDKLLDNISEVMQALTILQSTLGGTGIDDATSLQLHTSTRGKLIDLQGVAENMVLRLDIMVQSETMIIKRYVEKTEQSLEQVKRTLYMSRVPDKEIEPAIESTDEREVEPPIPSKKMSWADLAAQSTTKKGGLLPMPKNALIQRQIAHGVPIRAYTISDPDECHKREFLGWWCYSTMTHRFYTSLNGYILGGTTANIKSDNEAPTKFIEHNDCQEKATWNIPINSSGYWIRPIDKTSRRDQRVLTNRAKFFPASKTPGPKDKYIYRIGSKDTLASDLNAMTKGDYYLFADMTVNDALVHTAASEEIARRGEEVYL